MTQTSMLRKNCFISASGDSRATLIPFRGGDGSNLMRHWNANSLFLSATKQCRK